MEQLSRKVKKDKGLGGLVLGDVLDVRLKGSSIGFVVVEHGVAAAEGRIGKEEVMKLRDYLDRCLGVM